MEIQSTPSLVSKVYEKSQSNISKYRKIVKRPLTLTEKILSGHLEEIGEKNLDDAKNYVFLKPDRIALQDVTALAAKLMGLNRICLQARFHCTFNRSIQLK